MGFEPIYFSFTNYFNVAIIPFSHLQRSKQIQLYLSIGKLSYNFLLFVFYAFLLAPHRLSAYFFFIPALIFIWCYSLLVEHCVLDLKKKTLYVSVYEKQDRVMRGKNTSGFVCLIKLCVWIAEETMFCNS